MIAFNVAEETKNPRKNLPRSIILAITISTIIYILVSVVAITSTDTSILAASSAPLADIVTNNSHFSAKSISLISLFAIINGALIQIIMASRVTYGLAKKGHIPKIFSSINKNTHTPLFATVLIALLILITALWLPIETLAKSTSMITLVVFSFVNGSLIRIKLKKQKPSTGVRYPIILPIIGLILTVGMISTEVFF